MGSGIIVKEVVQLPGELRQYLEQALSANTRRAYANDLAHYRDWGGMIPTTPEHVATYLTAHAGTLAIATLQRRLVSVAKAQGR